MSAGKRFEAASAMVDRDRQYGPGEALKLVREFPAAKFDETIELAFRLGVDPRKADQMVRGTVSLPHGTGKSVRVAAFAAGDKAREAQEAGADVVGGEDLVDQVMKGVIEFDAAVATPDLMSVVGKAGRVLGPRGLMPNPKVGTVTPDVGKAVRELKAGRVEFRVEKSGIVHARFGKVSFGGQKLEENLRALLELLIKLKPSSAKGTYMKSVTISTTHGPGVKVDPQELLVSEAH